MSLYAGIDIGVGISREASRTAVVVLKDEIEIPVWGECFKPETKNFEARIHEISKFCREVILEAGADYGEVVTGVLIAEPKMRGVTFDHKNKRTGVVTKVTANLLSMFQIAQVRGAIVMTLESARIPVYSMVESKIKKAYTGDGRAKKELIIKFASFQWGGDMPSGFENDDDLADATMVAEIFRRRHAELERERKLGL